MLLPNHDLTLCQRMAKQVRMAVEDLGRREEFSGRTASIGCAEFGTHTTQAEGLVMAAELATSRGAA